jgi:pectin methylesterase-like acyl-CoA thioesterase
MSADRVLTGTEQYGSQIIISDAQGNGDYITIQASIDAAQAQTPAADSRWLVQIMPGEYQETLTLYEYIDTSGMGAGYSSHLSSLNNQAAIANGAECTISVLMIFLFTFWKFPSMILPDPPGF